jgi:hypothetical protein
MRKKFFKGILFVFILMLCSAILVGVKLQAKNVTTFKSLKKVGVVSMVENSGYNELKSSIDQKYTQSFVKILNETSNSMQNEIKGVLGEEYQSLKIEYDQITDYISDEIRKFNNSADYVAKRNELSSLKVKIDSLDKSSKEEYLDEFRKVLGEISTLNTKFNNNLKSKRERLDEIKGSVKELFVKNKETLIEIRRKSMESTREKLKELFVSYNVEVKELNDAFGIDKKPCDYPFDISSMQNCLVAGKLETECFNEILGLNGVSPVIYSENSSNLIS